MQSKELIKITAGDFVTMDNGVVKILSSKIDPLKEAIFFEGGKEKYYSVAFRSLRSPKSAVICVSSQIGCTENCTFCATADQKFQRNLSSAEIRSEILLGCEMLKDIMAGDLKKCDLYVIFEGMGEASRNLENCFSGFYAIYDMLSSMFNQLFFRIATSGNLDLDAALCENIKKYSTGTNRVNYEIKLSLHSVFDEERQLLLPSMSSRYSVDATMRSFYAICEKLGTKLIVNYMLLDYPGGCNYTHEHMIRLGELVEPGRTVVFLSRYSNTGKPFRSPDNLIFAEFERYLSTTCGLEIFDNIMLGSDIGAACGMLHYEE